MGLWQRPRARPATVATLPPRRGPPNVRFSMARSVRFSAAIDTSAPNRFLKRRTATCLFGVRPSHLLPRHPCGTRALGLAFTAITVAILVHYVPR